MSGSEKGKFDDFNRLDLTYHTISDTPLQVSVLTSRNARKTSEKRPVLVFWHGGGFVTGHRLYEPWWPRWLLELAQSNDAMILAPDFRLLPEASGTDVLDDVRTFWQWYVGALSAIAETELWQVRPDIRRTICAGQSAGAFIAMHSALEYQDASIQAVISLYGALCLDVPLLNIVQPRMIGGANPLSPRQAEANIRSYISRTRGTIRTHGNPLEDWDLVASIVQQGWLPRLAKKNPDARLDLVACLESIRTLPPIWLVHGQQDSVVPTESALKFANRVKEILPNASILLSIRPGEHTFDVSLGMDECWLREGGDFVQKYW